MDELLVPLDGSEYTCWPDLRRALNDWAIKEEFSFRTPRKELDAATFACASNACGWKMPCSKESGRSARTLHSGEHLLGIRHSGQRHIFPGRRYGHDTSNIVESLNKTLNSTGSSISLMEQRSECLAETQKCIAAGAQYAPLVTTAVQEGRKKWAQSNRVSHSFNVSVY
jgi:hypothetical protein